MVSVGGTTRELSLNTATGLKIGSGGTLAFGNIGDTLGSADNTDFIAFKRVNLTTGATNQSELRLYLGDDPTTINNSQDNFTIGTIAGGTWGTIFGFRSDGFVGCSPFAGMSTSTTMMSSRTERRLRGRRSA